MSRTEGRAPVPARIRTWINCEEHGKHAGRIPQISRNAVLARRNVRCLSPENETFRQERSWKRLRDSTAFAPSGILRVPCQSITVRLARFRAVSLLLIDGIEKNIVYISQYTSLHSCSGRNYVRATRRCQGGVKKGMTATPGQRRAQFVEFPGRLART